jgi:hypothetical protein
MSLSAVSLEHSLQLKAYSFPLMWHGISPELRPQTLMEDWIVERLVASHWRLRRAYRYEIQSTFRWRAEQANNPIHQMAREFASIPEIDPTQATAGIFLRSPVTCYPCPACPRILVASFAGTL